MKQDIKNFTISELRDLLKKQGLPGYCAVQVFGWIYKKRAENFDLMTDLSKKSRRFLNDNFYFPRLQLVKSEVSCDKTRKFLFRLGDRNHIETVFIPETKRGTICLSTQVGCKFSCKFCVSGKGGFKRNLSASEIVNQYTQVSDTIKPQKITNIVFMGIGEPLDNFDNTVKAVRIFTESKGIHIAKSKICVSTSGITPAIEDLADLNLGVKLSLSLHSADQDLRTKLMPINKKYPLTQVIKAVKQFSHKQKQSVMFEYVLIKGFNSNKEDAVKLANLLKGVRCKVNLIPYNASSFNYTAPLDNEIEQFSRELKKQGVFFTLRKPRGEDISAACGQLRSCFAEKR